MELRKRSVEVICRDGSTITVTVVDAEELPELAPVFLCLPAMGVPAAFYAKLAEPLVAEGWRLVTSDLRGNALSSVRASRSVNFGFNTIIVHDFPSIFAKARELFPHAPLYLLGHSLGGKIGLLYIASNPRAVAGVVLVATPSLHYTCWGFPRGLGVLLAVQTMRAIARLWGYFPGRRLGFGGTEAQLVIRDWAHQNLTGRYEPAGSLVNYEALLSDLDISILSLYFPNDFFAPQGAVEGLCRKLANAKVKLVGIGNKQMNHFNWVKNNTEVVSNIRDWLAKI
ncbi:MAG: alpha/beta fold hydrolase [Deltaproteobacteria bacterium]|nr:alpha/beta fold hydrolase [Deltaproteobacteria bacterium]